MKKMVSTDDMATMLSTNQNATWVVHVPHSIVLPHRFCAVIMLLTDGTFGMDAVRSWLHKITQDAHTQNHTGRM